VSNLLDNAAKFTPNGASVRLSCRESGSFAVIEVVDTGSGMSAATLARVFTPFEQETEEAGRNRGLGLGLPIARRIVEMHGGQISAQSDGVGKGCAFTVRIPR
jgi:signal transduction histidine kinase